MPRVIVFVALLLPAVASGQLAEQSALTPADRDPTFELTLEHLA